MIDPKKKLWKWGPIDGQVLYIDDFMFPMITCKNLFRISWSDALAHLKGGKVLFISEHDALYSHGVQMFKKCVLDEAVCKKLYDKWSRIKDEMVNYILETTAEKLKKMSSQELQAAIDKFYTMYAQFWDYGLIPEIANFGGEKLLKEAVMKNYPDDALEVLEALSAPDELSFYQIEELDLLKLKLAKKSLAEHQKKYFWLNNSYGKVRITSLEWFKERADKIPESEAKEKIKAIEDFPKNTKRKKTEVIKKFNILEEIRVLGSRLSFSIWWQDYRKKFIWMAIHTITLFAKELGRRHKVPLSDFVWYNSTDLKKLAKEGVKAGNITERRKGYVSFYDYPNNNYGSFVGKEAEELISKYTNVEVPQGIKEFKGVVVSKGKVKGQARLLSGARHFDSMREGEILVTSMTSPEFIVAMRKASAIVTDEGGMTCHAAIVSRELGIPCVVGTKIATRVLRNGDTIEVDAEKGIIKILKRGK